MRRETQDLSQCSTGMRGIKYDKDGPMIPADEANRFIAKTITSGITIPAKGKAMSEQVEQATQIVEEAIVGFTKAFGRFQEMQQSFQANAKKTSGAARDAAERLADGIQRLEKAADLNKVERYVDLLERMAKACSTLADLNQSGRLDGIAKALKQ